jgi:hypothetical protein
LANFPAGAFFILFYRYLDGMTDDMVFLKNGYIDMMAGPRLVYGSADEVLLYILPLSSLNGKKLTPFSYRKIDDFTDARVTMTGGLKIRRRHEKEFGGAVGKAHFPRNEYKIIRKYMSGIK